MGRKIPGKKHKGVKDPEKQQAVRQNSIKNKINCPPTNPDEQPVPKSLQKIIEFKERLSSGQINKPVVKPKSQAQIIKPKSQSGIHKKSTQEITKSSSATKKSPKRLKIVDKPAPKFTQLPGETNRAFLARVNDTVKEYLKEAHFENKYGVTVQRDEKTGDIIGVEKKPKDEIEEIMKKVAKKKGKKIKKKTDSEPKLSKTEKRKLKLQEKKEQKEMKKADGFDKFKDDIKFGETVHAPPTLTAPKKVEKTNVASRPGKKDLLLKRTISKSAPSALANKSKVSITSIFKKANSNEKPVVNKKGKRKDLPIGVRKQLETEQKNIIETYRNLKAHKIQSKT